MIECLEVLNSNSNLSLYPPILAGKSFKDDILRAHNQFRKDHSSPALKWSGKLAAEAQKAADEAAKTNTLKPVSLNNVGQNMAAMSGGELTGQRVTEMWYEEEKNYNYSSPGFSSSTGTGAVFALSSYSKIRELKI